MMLISFLILLQFNSNIVLSQRVFANPAVTDPAPCACDLRVNICDANCCCDPDCTDSDLTVSPICNSVRTVSSYSSSAEQNLQTWNCSNTTSASRYDYFPFVCVRFQLNEIIGKFYSAENIQSLKSYSDASTLRSRFVAQNPELFQPITLSSSTTRYNSVGAPVLLTSGTRFTLPGNSAGFNCQANVPVLFGINSDVTCTSSTLTSFCTTVTSTTAVLTDGQTSSNVTFRFYQKTYTTPTSTTRNSTQEYYFKNSFPNLNQISSTTGSIYDYCSGRHPMNRTQRYFFCTSTDTSLCPGQYQVYSGCTLRENLHYSTIPESFFTNVTTSIDGPTNFADFDGSQNVTSITCATGNIQRVFYRFNYSSINNTISTVEVYVLFNTASATTLNPRITIEWNDIANNTASSTTIPRGYLDGEILQFRRNNIVSDVSNLVPNSDGLCIDATRKTLRYKQSTSSFCFLQLQQQTIKQCHDLKLNMYLYLNAFYAPASGVLSYPSAAASLVTIRDTNQDLTDLDQIDETRPNNRLNQTYIGRTTLGSTAYAIYDTSQILPVCYNVPSGVYIEFGYVRLYVSPTIYYERIVSVQYNYTYSNWQFDCTQANCSSTLTQQYPVSFQSAFVDYTNLAFYSTGVTRADITSADNYIQHLLWLISPEYNGEPGYRNYTIAMILIFIAISIVVMHVLLFGLMCPF